MADMLRDGMAWLNGQMKGQASQTVSYRRGVLTLASLSVTFGRTTFRITDPTGGTRVERSDKDITFDLADLLLGGEATLPERGDEVRETVGSEVWVYEALAPTGEPVWRWCDGHQERIRVHLKRTAVE